MRKIVTSQKDARPRYSSHRKKMQRRFSMKPLSRAEKRNMFQSGTDILYPASAKTILPELQKTQTFNRFGTDFCSSSLGFTQRSDSIGNESSHPSCKVPLTVELRGRRKEQNTLRTVEGLMSCDHHNINPGIREMANCSAEHEMLHFV